jgi:predicted ATPase/DNA-binding winged helix-turn-helix (wHTH) protein
LEKSWKNLGNLLVRDKAEKQRTIYRFGEFEINTDEGFLLREGEIVPLSPKIFDTLLLLVQNNGRMLSKDEIMETVWADSFVEETNLTSNISRLRKILHAGGAQFIETFPKRGYRFRGEVEEIETEMILTRRVTARVRQIVEEIEDSGDETDEFTPLLATVPNNLAARRTQLIGREKEIGEIENLLLGTNVRMVTLTGIGGTGKTRIAQEIARRMLADFADGVFFVALADIRNPEFVASTVAQIFGVKEAGEKSLIENLKNHFSEKHLLLVVDNFEQVISAAHVLAELLAAAPRLKILATSRALLHLPFEREFVVPPLDLPESGGRIPLPDLSKNESVKLFLERAQNVKSSFSLTGENAASVAEICRRLEGLPLAIELAAARIKILSPAQILSRLENRLKILTGGALDLPARQQTMRGAIDWSYDLLDEDEKILFRRLSVFAGGFNVETAEAIVLNLSSSGETEIDILNIVTALIENSLIIQKETANDESRLRMLEVVREFALEKLEASGESLAVRKNHAAFFLALAQEAEQEFFGEQGEIWLKRLEDEHENLRAALLWSTAADAETAANLAGALRNFWILRNHIAEGRKWLETILEQSEAAPLAVRLKLINGLGHTAGYQGDLETARKAHEKGLAEGKATNDLRQIALSVRGLGFVAKWKGDIAAAGKFYEEGLAYSRELDDENGIAVSLTTLGDLARMADDYAAARPLFEEALEICKQTGNKQGVVGSLNNLGAVTFGEGDYAAAHSYYAEAINLVRKLEEKVSLSYALDGFAALAVRHGDARRAAQIAGACERLRELLGFETEPAERRFREAYLSEIRAALDKDDFSAVYEQGRRLNPEEAIAIALEPRAAVRK